MLLRASVFNDTEAVIEDCVMKRFVIGTQIVRTLRSFMMREYPFLTPVAACDVDPSPLHVMPSQPNSRDLIVESAAFEFVVEKAQQPIECRFVAAVWGGGQQNQVTLAVARKAFQKFKSLLPI